jgi:hypothetical protein
VGFFYQENGEGCWTMLSKRRCLFTLTLRNTKGYDLSGSPVHDSHVIPCSWAHKLNPLTPLENEWENST